MKSAKWNENNLTVKPHKLKSLIRAVLFALITAAACVSVSLILGWVPESIFEKVLNAVFFTLCMIIIAFAGSASLDGIRNIFALPTFKVDDENIFVCKHGITPLSELEKTELKKKGKLLVFTFKDGSTAVLKSRLSDIPLESVNYAISLRQKAK